MRLLIVGSLQGQIGAATKIAMDRGAKVTHAIDIDQAMAELRSGRGADLVMADVMLDIGRLVRALAAERICTPAPTHDAPSMPSAPAPRNICRCRPTPN